MLIAIMLSLTSQKYTYILLLFMTGDCDIRKVLAHTGKDKRLTML